MDRSQYKILLVYPEYPETFWGLKHALKFVFKKAAHQPLGLMTVANILPENWPKKLVDLNVNKLEDRDIEQADFVFLGGMSIQKESAKKIIQRCRQKGTKIVAGGPLFTSSWDDFSGVDHFVLNEAEITLPRFLKDLERN